MGTVLPFRGSGPWRIDALLGCVMLVCAMLMGCSRGDSTRAPGPMRVVVTVPPLAGLVRPLLPAGASVTVLMSSGKSEHGYEFTPGDIAAIGNADLVVYVGAGLEEAVEEFLAKHPAGSRRQDVCFMSVAGFPTGTPPREEGQHDEEHEEGHHHHGVDPHLWLDPQLCLKLVDALAPVVKKAAEAAGASPGGVDAALAKEKADIVAMDLEYKTRLGPLKGYAIVTHHNAWQRPADRYGLKVAAVMREVEGAEMTPQAVASTVDAIRQQGARAVFVEPQFDRVAAQRIAEAAGVRLALLDPLGDGDWFKMMRTNLDSLVRALGK